MVVGGDFAPVESMGSFPGKSPDFEEVFQQTKVASKVPEMSTLWFYSILGEYRTLI